MDAKLKINNIVNNSYFKLFNQYREITFSRCIHDVNSDVKELYWF